MEHRLAISLEVEEAEVVEEVEEEKQGMHAMAAQTDAAPALLQYNSKGLTHRLRQTPP